MLRENKGFTLVELLAVMVVLGVIFAVVATKFDIFSSSAKRSSMIITIEELNTREKLFWSNIKLSEDGYVDDQTLFDSMDYDLGRLKWVIGPSTTGGTVATDGGNVTLVRAVSTRKEPARWSQ